MPRVEGAMHAVRFVGDCLKSHAGLSGCPEHLVKPKRESVSGEIDNDGVLSCVPKTHE